jgi:crotonobetainyl-CoA:carnitine CoA-transferase CaiB-like acyl-CoA transferase
MMQSLSPQALHGVRVLDFTRVLAGPFCTMLLGDLGADVVKVEQPIFGDETRQWGPPWFGAGQMSAYFASVNRNKRSLILDLKTPTGRDQAQRLATHSHIVIENFKAGGMAEFGLDYHTLHSLNPALVYCSITGFGQDGPYKDRPGYDYVIQAMSGLMSVTGPVDGEAHKVGVAVSDVFTGLFAVTGILAALRHAEHTGEGQYLDLALLDSQVAALVNVASNALVSQRTPSRMGNQHPNIVPYQTFQAADQAFVVAVGNDRQFTALCDLMGQPDWADDPRFATNPQRLAHRAEVVSALQSIFVTRPASHWVDALLAVGIPTGPINSVMQALHDPQVQSRGMVQSVQTADGELPLVASPLHFTGTPASLRLPPPALGEHTEVVLHEWLGE